MTGNIRYRERTGHGKRYGDGVLQMAVKVWEAVGCPYTAYLVPVLPRIVREYEGCFALLKPESVKETLLRLSASTLDLAYRGLPKKKPFAVPGDLRARGQWA